LELGDLGLEQLDKGVVIQTFIVIFEVN